MEIFEATSMKLIKTIHAATSIAGKSAPAVGELHFKQVPLGAYSVDFVFHTVEMTLNIEVTRLFINAT